LIRYRGVSSTATIPYEAFLYEVRAGAAQITLDPPQALDACSDRLGLDLQEAELQRQMAESDDFPEGVTAFPQKREADFRGR
jgi:enoyl-CoA hydratase/carnithine racemase